LLTSLTLQPTSMYCGALWPSSKCENQSWGHELNSQKAAMTLKKGAFLVIAVGVGGMVGQAEAAFAGVGIGLRAGKEGAADDLRVGLETARGGRCGGSG